MTFQLSVNPPHPLKEYAISTGSQALQGTREPIDRKWRPNEANLPVQASATTLSQCLTGVAEWPCRCNRQPMLAVATAAGLPPMSASSLLFPRRCESEDCNKE